MTARRRRRLRWRAGALMALVLGLWWWLGGPGRATSSSSVEPVMARSDPTALAAADRLNGCAERVQQAISSGQLGAAFAALDAASGLRLEPEGLARQRARLQASVERALELSLASIATCVAEGRVAQARVILADLRSQAHPAVQAGLAELATRQGWQALPPERAPRDLGLPAPAALAWERSVRLRVQTDWVIGGVVGSSPGELSEELTVRVRDAKGGAQFVFVPRSTVEPVAASADEALDQATLALRSGDPSLAALWLTYAEARTGPTPRVAALRARLPQ